MIKSNLIQGCKNFSASSNQSMWYITWTNWRIKTILSSQSVSSIAQSCLTLGNPKDHSTSGLPAHCQLPGVYPNSCPLSCRCHPAISSCRPLFLLPSIFPSIRVFSKESVLHIRWSKYWSFSFNVSPSDEYSGLISFRMDWLDFLTVQGTL